MSFPECMITQTCQTYPLEIQKPMNHRPGAGVKFDTNERMLTSRPTAMTEREKNEKTTEVG